MQENIALNKSISFCVGIRNYCNALYCKRETSIANQLLRSGMAIGANISEAQQAESRSDFIHKMKIAAKEASETSYWLSICERSNMPGFQHDLIKELNELIAIISKIIITAKKNALKTFLKGGNVDVQMYIPKLSFPNSTSTFLHFPPFHVHHTKFVSARQASRPAGSLYW
jgi:four helix bundle protein